MEPIFHPGMQVVDSEGRYAGTVEDVLYDEQGAARYLVVRDRGIFSDDVVLPVSGAQVEGDNVRYPLTRDEIHSGERYDEQRFGAAAGLTSVAASSYDRQDEDR
ncbi:MAG TPA: PRC-barrel domain-containing protein [Chloroflexota bacterium]|jgi:hypothetical protein|nr:PRC-barrel domain-containing protein [Chloroflexota bacterium]